MAKHPTDYPLSGCGVATHHRVQYTAAMRIPHTQLSPATLRAVVEEFVTRDGTDHSKVERRIEHVLHQFDVGGVELHFDAETGTCNILTMDGTRSAGDGDK